MLSSKHPGLDDVEFLTGGGTMGRLMRSHDWSGSPVGPPADWPQSLRSVIGLMLGSKFAMFVAWGNELTFFYNDAYAAILGSKHPGALGAPFRDIWSEIWADIGPLVAASFAGEATYLEDLPLLVNRHGFGELANFTFSYSPVRDESGGISGVFCAVVETTAQVQLERRQAFQLDVEEVLGSIENPDEIMIAGAAALGRHLGVQRVGYSEIQGDDSTVVLSHCFADGVQPLTGSYALDSFGLDAIARQRLGLSEVCHDVLTDPLQDASVWAAIDTRSFVSVPLIRDGRFRASLYVNSREPRRWSPEDVMVIEHVAARTWDAVDRARAEAALRASETRLKLAQQAAGIGVWDWDLGTGKVTWSPEMYAILGLDPEQDGDAPYAAWLGILHPEDREEAHRVAQAAAHGGQAFATEFRVVRRGTGETGWVRSYGVPVPGPDSRPAQVVGVNVDVSAERRREDELETLAGELRTAVAASERERDRIYDLTKDLLAVAGFDGYLKSVNPAWERLLGHSSQELLSRPFADFIHPDDHAAAVQVIAGMRSGQTLQRFEDRLLRADGQIVRIAWAAVPEGDRFYAVGRDVTHEREREEALRQAQKMEAMGQLTGGVAHDFNNLLTPIMGSLDMLMRRGVGSERERRLIDGALQSAERAKTLVQRLLAFARRQPLQPSAVDLQALVGGMAELIASTSGPRVELRILLPDDLPPANADANQLEMAVLNLAVNARDAMPNGGVLTISAARASVPPHRGSGLHDGDYVRLSVRDTGTGMDEATLARAVEPFFSTKGVGKGTGLGLSMVHGLASQLEGELIITSSPGQGTNVELWLPVSSGPIGGPGETRGSDGPRRGALGTALLVDDEDLVRMSTADMLLDLGYDVVEASSAEEAKRLLAGGLQLSLLVTDHLMPGLTGAELAVELRAARPDLPVLIVSGYAEAEGIAPGLARLTKPFRNAELADSLAGLASARGRA